MCPDSLDQDRPGADVDGDIRKIASGALFYSIFLFSMPAFYLIFVAVYFLFCNRAEFFEEFWAPHMAVVVTAFASAILATSIGLRRRREWARLSAILLAWIGVALWIPLLIWMAIPKTGKPGIVYVASVTLLTTNVFQLIWTQKYLNLEHVKAAFRADDSLDQ